MIHQVTCGFGELMNLLRILTSKRYITPNDRIINLRAFNVVRGIFLKQVDVVTISNGLWISFIHTINRSTNHREILGQVILSILITESLHCVAEHLRIFRMQSDLVVSDKKALAVFYSIVVQGNVFLG